MGVESELAVIIVLNDPLILSCPAQQLLPPVQRGDDPRGEVVGRRNVQYLGIPQPMGADALFVHRRADAADTASGIDPADLAIARFFHPVAEISA